VKKTSVYLDPGLDIELARVARADGITKAELIRRVLRNTVDARPRPRLTAIGAGESDGPGDISVNHDKYLAGILRAEHDAL
jgi:hypothetical protein